jgi:hypothetical protein
MKPFHPLADVLPIIGGAEFDRLADIREHGLKDAITLYRGKILDGRNRERACRKAGVRPRYVEFDGSDPAALVLSKNLVRRHLGAVRARHGGCAQGQPAKGIFDGATS